jgi:hypothetical protein
VVAAKSTFIIIKSSQDKWMRLSPMEDPFFHDPFTCLRHVQ